MGETRAALKTSIVSPTYWRGNFLGDISPVSDRLSWILAMTPNQLVGVTHVTRRHCRCRASHSCRWEGSDSGSLAIGRKNSTCIDTTTKAYWYNMKSLSSKFSWSFRLIHRSTHIIRAILITSTYRTCSSFIRAAHGPDGPAERPKGDGALEYCTSLPAWTLSGVTVVSTRAVGFLAGSKSS